MVSYRTQNYTSLWARQKYTSWWARQKCTSWWKYSIHLNSGLSP